MKRRIYTPGTLKPRMSTLVISLSALVMVTIAAFAPATVAAADIAFVAGNSKAVGIHCSEALVEADLVRNYGTFSGCLTDSADHSVSSPSADVAERYVGEWRGTVITAQTDAKAAPAVGVNSVPSEGYIGEWRGTIITAQTGANAAAEVTANSGPMEQHRTYGYD